MLIFCLGALTGIVFTTLFFLAWGLLGALGQANADTYKD